MRSCGTCRFWFDDEDTNGKESEYGDCEGPIPASVHSPILSHMHRNNDGRECQAWQETIKINDALLRSHIGESITIKSAFDVISFESFVNLADINIILSIIEENLGKIGRIGLSEQVNTINDSLVKIAFDIKAKIKPSVFKK
jgi:hypothetical protein